MPERQPQQMVNMSRQHDAMPQYPLDDDYTIDKQLTRELLVKNICLLLFRKRSLDFLNGLLAVSSLVAISGTATIEPYGYSRGVSCVVLLSSLMLTIILLNVNEKSTLKHFNMLTFFSTDRPH